MTTLAPDEVRRAVRRFEAEALAAKLVAPKPVKTHRQVLPSIYSKSCSKSIEQIKGDIQKATLALAKVWNVSPESILGLGRKQQACNARLMLYAYMRQQGVSFPLIAQAMGINDRVTPYRGFRQWGVYMNTVAGFSDAWERFVQEVNRV